MNAIRRPVHRDAYRPPPFLIDHVELEFQLDAAVTRVRARVELRRNTDGGRAGEPLRLDGEDLALQAITLNGRPLPEAAYEHDDSGLTIPEVPARFVLDTEVVIRPRENTALMGLYAADDLLCTQCEPEAFRRITFFPDRPDVLAPFRVTLIADAKRYPVLLANGNPEAYRRLPDGRHCRVWDDPHPKPAYLFALVAGKLEHASRTVTTAGGRTVTVNCHVEPGHAERCGHALDALRRALAWDEANYGCEYDLDALNLVAVSAYTQGAMENKGLLIFNDRYLLADPTTATDADYRAVEALVAHEYLHNWSGNRVTCRDWFQLCLKEGFTVFREQQFVADQGWAGVRRIEDARLMRTHQFSEDSGPLAHAVRPETYQAIDNFYTDTVYSKGAELVRMLATLLGPAAFRRGSDIYFRRHDGRATTVEDFLDCMAEGSGRELGAFRRWYEQVGTPVLEIDGTWEANSGCFELRVRQSLPPGEPALHMPLALGLLDADGAEQPVWLPGEDRPAPGTRILELDRAERRFRFQGLEAAPVPSLLRGFSAPVEVRYEYSDEDLALLAGYDTDAYGRWNALQALAGRRVRALLGGAAGPGAPLTETFRLVLDHHGDDPGLAAAWLALPDTAELTAWTGADIEAVHEARKRLTASLGEALRERWSAVHRACGGTHPADATPAAVGRRALRNVCLGYLMALGDNEATGLCQRQYRDANSLTETLAALEALVENAGDRAEEALADFRRRWHDEPLVMDHWLAAQAAANQPDTLVRVTALLADPAFVGDHPNRVRALVETFCRDSLRFHAADGSGYRFLTDRVLALDPVNPPLAAGLLRYLAANRHLDENRRALMHAELERIACSETLSAESRELVDTTLSN